MKYTDKYHETYCKYLEYHEHAWSPTTYNSEKSKLNTIIEIIKVVGASGNDLYKELKKRDYKPYSIKTLMQSASSWYEFGLRTKTIPYGINPFSDFTKRNAQVFRNAYRPSRLAVDFDKAQELIQTIPDTNLRLFCLAILHSGLRIHEAYKVNYEDSTVIGKGGKLRKTYFKYNGDIPPPTQNAVRQALLKLGLKPHDLRKLLATRLSRHGLTHSDIMEVMGWSSIETASKYFQPLNQEKLKSKLDEAIKGEG
jgi:integrase